MANRTNRKEAERVGQRLVKTTAEDVLGLALDIHGNLTENTPVDTGHARINWVPSIGAPVSKEIEGSNPASTPDPLATFSPASPRDPLVITNNVPYIEALNNGHSPQAKAGFVEDAIQEAIDSRKNRRLD